MVTDYGGSILTANSISQPTLYSDTDYWIVLSASTDTLASFMLNEDTSNVGLRGSMGSNDTDWDTWITTNAAFRISGDEVAVAPVPEPATMLLFGIALLGLAGVNRRKK